MVKDKCNREVSLEPRHKRKNYKHFHAVNAVKFNKLNEVDKFLEIHHLPELRGEIEKFNIPLSHSICTVKTSPQEKSIAHRVSLTNQMYKTYTNLTRTQKKGRGRRLPS